jgi:GGDEF domain-containing protein
MKAVVLREVGTRLRDALRASDTVARLGGDEFGALLQTGSEERIVDVVRKILRCMEQPIECNGQSIDVGASIGIARYPEHGDDPGTLIRHADIAMYLAKAANSEFAFYDPSRVGTQQEQLSLLGELRRLRSELLFERGTPWVRRRSDGLGSHHLRREQAQCAETKQAFDHRVP